MARHPVLPSLGQLPQVFTVLGIPIWDTNTSTHPDLPRRRAHGAAPVLRAGHATPMTGAGASTSRPRVPGRDRAAPRGAVPVALVTGILTIGLNVFALAADFAVAASWLAPRADRRPISRVTDAVSRSIRTSPRRSRPPRRSAWRSAGEARRRTSRPTAAETNIWSILLDRWPASSRSSCSGRHGPVLAEDRRGFIGGRLPPHRQRDPVHRRGPRRHLGARRCRHARRSVRGDDRRPVGHRERGQPRLRGEGDRSCDPQRGRDVADDGAQLVAAGEDRRRGRAGRRHGHGERRRPGGPRRWC